jgi:7,8-dihydropterin-6-yl-methyl-4-(beta-D-ribofuranosyl)aminobenzene 5'-phosphate synthase
MTHSLTVLMADEAAPGFDAEHGLSLLIERDGDLTLFDAGRTPLFLSNADRLGVDLRAVARIALSHGHYDHGGGLPALKARLGTVPTFVSGPDPFAPKYSRKDGRDRYAGLEYGEAFVQSFASNRIELAPDTRASKALEIAPGLAAIVGFPRTRATGRDNPRFLVRRGALAIDRFTDELALASRGPGGWTLLVGCAHPGILDMLDAARGLLDGPIVAIAGGTHLIEAPSERIDECVTEFSRAGLRLAALGHCTGEAAMAEFARRLPAFSPLRAGDRFELP